MGRGGKQRAKQAPRGSSLEKPLFTGKARPKYVYEKNVFDAALDRIRWLFEEFDGHVSVSNSGGKDSTVVLELALIVARERNELPLKVVWLDQECEYEATVEYQRYIMNRPEIDFQWYQIPFRLFNASNLTDPWLRVWGPGEEWVREKEPNSIHENDFTHYLTGEPVDRFKDVLLHINQRTGGAILTGMRSEESPARRLFMTTKPAYKWITWGSAGTYIRDEERKVEVDEHGDPTGRIGYFMFHPIFDWSYRDIWKAIDEHNWRYNTHYDAQFRYGVPVRAMRVSNYHHVQAIGSLEYLQEVEPRTWEAATRRLEGINTVGHFGGATKAVSELPYMFKDWEEYLHHLIDNLIEVEEYRNKFYKMETTTIKALPDTSPDEIRQAIAAAVLKSDFFGVSIEAFVMQRRGKAKLRAAQEEAFSTGGNTDVDEAA